MNKLILASFITVLLCACSVINPSGDDPYQQKQSVPIGEMIAPPFVISDLKQGGYIGGALTYNEDHSLNQLCPGMFVRLVQRKPGSSEMNYGYLFVRMLDTNRIVFDLNLYDGKGAEISKSVGVSITNGQSYSIDGDGTEDIRYIRAKDDGNNRAGFENSMHLKFLCNDSTGSQLMFMLLAEEMPGGNYPTGLAVVNQSGRITVEVSLSNQAGSSTLYMNTGQVPSMQSNDILIDLDSGNSYIVNRCIQTPGSRIILEVAPAGDMVPFDDVYLNIEGNSDTLAQKYSPLKNQKLQTKGGGSTSTSKTTPIFDKSFNLDLINEAGLKANMSGRTVMTSYIRAGVGWSYSLRLWKPRLTFTVNGYFETRLITDCELNFTLDFAGRFQKNYNVTLADYSFTFFIGGIPVQIGGGVKVGMEASASVTAHIFTGYKLHSEFGASISMYVGTSCGVNVTPINTFSVTQVPMQISLRGDATVKPYLIVDFWGSVAGITLGVKVTPYVKGSIHGEITINDNVRSGNMSYKITPGLSIDAYCGLGVSLPVIGRVGKNWNLGRIAALEFPKIDGSWSPPEIDFGSLIMPDGLSMDNSDLQNGILLSWNPVNLATGYMIEKYINDRKIFSAVTAFPAFLDTNSNDWQYTNVYKFWAINRSVCSVTNTTNFIPQTPAAPSGLTAVYDNRNIRVSYLPVSGALRYHFSRLDTNNSTITNFYTMNTSYTDSAITPGHSYQYSVSAVKWSGEGSPSVSSICYVPPAIMVLHTKLDSSSGITDEGGLVGGNPAFAPVHFGNGVTCDSYKYVKFGLSSTPGLTAGTVEFWFKPSFPLLNGIASGTGKVPFVINSDDSVSKYGIYLLFHQSHGFRGTFYDATRATNVVVQDTVTRWNAGDVVHIALVWDFTGFAGGKTMAIYVNGTNTASVTNMRGMSVPANFDDIIIGNLTSFDRPVSGIMDNLKIYNYAKTDFSDRFQE